MKKNLFKKIVNGNFSRIMDGGIWNYDRFGFGELEGKVYRVELEGEGSNEDVIELRDGLSVEGIIEEGVNRGFFEVTEEDGIFYEEDLEDEMMDWLNGLSK